MRKSRIRKVTSNLRAEYRDIRVLISEFRFSLLLFLIVIFGGTILIFSFYKFPGSDSHPTLPEALHATFSLLFFETVLPFPSEWYLQIFFFLIPILGVAVLVDGFIRFGTALINKQNRGQKWQVAMASTYKNHIIICGMGRTGYRITLELLKFGRDIVAIESNQDGRFVEKAKSLDITMILADARRSENLLKANVKQADAIIPCTADELANLEIALDARELNPEIKVVMRMFDADLAKRVEKGFGIHTAFSTSALAAPIFAAAAMRVDVKHSFYVGDQLQNLSEVEISPGSKLKGWTVERMERELGLSFVSYQDGDKAIMYPDQEEKMKPGAKILIIASIDTLYKINEIN